MEKNLTNQPEEKEVKVCRWVKASERSPEPKPEMDNNKEYSFHCRCEGKRIVLYFWSFNWWGERSDGSIYGISEKVFSKLEWLEEISSPVLPNKEVKSKEKVLSQFDPNDEYPSYYHESHVLQAMEYYAAQFKPSNKEGKQDEVELRNKKLNLFDKIVTDYERDGNMSNETKSELEGLKSISQPSGQGKELRAGVDVEKAAEEVLKTIDNTEWDGWGNPVWHNEAVIKAMVSFAGAKWSEGDAAYWKQRCEAAERLMIDYDPLYPNGMKKDYENWQSLKQKQ